MSFLGNLFGGGDSPPPTPAQATPRLSDATADAASREQSSLLKNRSGADKTILTSGLGDTSSGPSNVSRTTALGGNTSLVT